MNFKRIFWLIGMFWFVGGTVLSIFAEDRTWNDRDGKYQVEAMLLDYDGKEVKLKKKADGKTISIALEKLSLPDQVYVKKMMDVLGEGKSSEKSENPFEQSVAESKESKRPVAEPKRTGSSSRKKEPVRDEEEDDEEESMPTSTSGAFTGKIPITRIQSARTIRTDLARTTWSIKPTPVAIPKGSVQPSIVDFPFGKQDFSIRSEVSGIAFSSENPDKLLAALVMSFRNDDVMTKVFFADVKTGLIFSQAFPVALEPLSLSPDGKRALFLQKKGGRISGEGTHLTISDTEQKKLPCVGVLAPFAQLRDKGNDSYVSWADWVDGEQILAQSKSGRLLLLHARTGEPVWTLDTNSSFSKSVLSQDKKYVIATQSHDSLPCILEVQTGKPIGLLQPARGYALQSPSFAFSPEGTKIAAFSDGMIHLWDTATGAAKEPFYVGDSLSFRSDLYWIDNLYLIADGVLIETEQQLPIWKYSGTCSKDVVFGGRYWHVPSSLFSKDVSFPIWGIVIPHGTMPKLAKLTDDKKFCYRPGLSIKLVVESSVPDSGRVREHVAKMLTANGCRVNDSGEVVLTVGMRNEGQKEMTYRSIGFGGGGEERVSYTLHDCFYRMESNGQVLWNRSFRTVPPPMLMDRSGKSTQESVTEQTTPKVDWFLSVKLPKKIPFDKAGRSNIIPDNRRR